METISTKIYPFILLAFLLPACSPVVQRAYIATSPNINCFNTAKEKNLKISLFANHYELQSNFALSKSFGISADLSGAYLGQLGGEIAGIYYKNFNERHYFELRSGYGYYYNNARINNLAWSFLAGERGKWYSSYSDTRYHKILIQPAYTIKHKKVNYGFGVKISAVYFDKYSYYRRIREQDYYNYDTYSDVNFRYKWGFILEPVMRVQFNNSWFLQLSGIFSNNIEKNPLHWATVGHEGHLIDQGQNGHVHTPQHINFLFTFGYEIKFGNKKNSIRE